MIQHPVTTEAKSSLDQIKEERLILYRKREPEVKKIEKKKTSVETEKNYPPKEKEQEPVEYKITNVPMVSDFKTSTIEGEDISPKFNTDSQRNYFQVGYGNYSKFLADGNISHQLDKNTEVGIDIHGITTNGLEKEYKSALEENLEASRKKDLTIITPFMKNEWEGFVQVTDTQMLQKVDTTFAKEGLDSIIDTISTLPSDKKFINKITKIVTDRKAGYDNNTIDWGTAEALAYGSLLTEGFDVRISGQDVERGTFSHRHAVIKVEESEEEVVLLNDIKNKKGNFYIYNSHLSEYGVVGFEYGYALASPNTLTIWEAQFGDFSNGAQIMIDQYISCGEDKWNNQNGIVMLLPHGYEGQGAEHSSARMERYLQLCARHNMYVADCTTPANFFHLLRRQMKTKFRKPLVVFSPKSLLRHPLCVSTKEELYNGSFQETIDDNSVDKKKVKTLVFCTGKFYYDILSERENLGRNDVALVRIEQLFPLPIEQLKEIIAKYPNADDYVWAQEEPKNMGAYSFMLMNFDLVKWRLASLKAYAAPAAGSHTRDRRRHADAIRMVFDKNLFR